MSGPTPLRRRYIVDAPCDDFPCGWICTAITRRADGTTIRREIRFATIGPHDGAFVVALWNRFVGSANVFRMATEYTDLRRG